MGVQATVVDQSGTNSTSDKTANRPTNASLTVSPQNDENVSNDRTTSSNVNDRTTTSSTAESNSTSVSRGATVESTTNSTIPESDNKTNESQVRPVANEVTIKVNKIIEWLDISSKPQQRVISSEEIKGAVGDPYSIDSNMRSYKVNRVEGSLTGNFTTDSTVNIYYYPSNSNITVNYISPSGANYKDEGFPNIYSLLPLDDELPFQTWDAPQNDDGTYKQMNVIDNGLYYDEPDYMTVNVVLGNTILEEVIPASAHMKFKKVDVGTSNLMFYYGIDKKEYDLVSPTGQGKFIQVNYYYKQVKVQTEGKANAKFFNMDTGEQIVTAKTKKGKLGESYNWDKEKNLKGYKLVKTFGYDNGVFTKEDRNVDFLYKKYKTIKVSAIFKDIDTGRKLQEDSSMNNMTVGDSYSFNETSQLNDPIMNSEYEFVKADMNNDNPFSAVLDEEMVNKGNVEMTYYFKKRTAPHPYLNMTPIRTKFVDLDGKSIAEDEVISQRQGTNYKAKTKSVPGYRLVHTDGNAEGITGNSEIVVTFVYQKDAKKAADVIVKYQDTKGNKISDDVIRSGNIGDSYNTEQKRIGGYTFKQVKGNVAGKLTDKSQVVIYIYAKTKESVLGHSKTPNGNSESTNRANIEPMSNFLRNYSLPSSSNNAKSYPKTGENTRNSLLLSSIGSILILGIVVFASRKKYSHK